jgi:DNA-binding NtrC family response regulator
MANQPAPEELVDSAATGTPTSGKQTILLADDDVAVLRLAKMILEKHGYSVLGAENGERVIDVFKASRHNVTLIILDQRMPGPGLEATVRSLFAIQPRVRVLLMSGLTEPEMAPDTRQKLCGFIGKPFRGGELLRAVQTALAIA